MVLVVEGGRIAVDGPSLGRFHGAQVVQWLPDNVKQPSQSFRTHGNTHLLAGIVHLHAPGQTVGSAQGQTADPVVAHVLLHFQNQLFSNVVQHKGIKQVGQFIRGKFDVYDGSDHLDDFSGGHWLLLI